MPTDTTQENPMRKERQKMSRKASRKDFRAKAKPHPLNTSAPVGTMRGGIRL